MAGAARIELATSALTVHGSTAELHANIIKGMERMVGVEPTVPAWKAVTAHADTRSIPNPNC